MFFVMRKRRRVDIAMKEEAGEFVLTIRDNGRGISESEKSESLGILGMRERAHLIEGEIDILGVEGKERWSSYECQSPTRKGFERAGDQTPQWPRLEDRT